MGQHLIVHAAMRLAEFKYCSDWAWCIKIILDHTERIRFNLSGPRIKQSAKRSLMVPPLKDSVHSKYPISSQKDLRGASQSQKVIFIQTKMQKHPLTPRRTTSPLFRCAVSAFEYHLTLHELSIDCLYSLPSEVPRTNLPENKLRVASRFKCSSREDSIRWVSLPIPLDCGISHIRSNESITTGGRGRFWILEEDIQVRT